MGSGRRTILEQNPHAFRTALLTSCAAVLLSNLLAAAIVFDGTAAGRPIAEKSSVSSSSSAPSPSGISSDPAPTASPSGASAVTQGNLRLKLIDISHFDTVSDWQAAKQTVDGVYIKATEGTTVTDPKFAENAKGAQKADIPTGFYHYFWPSTAANAVLQAEYFFNAIKGFPNDLRPALDLEEANGQTAATISQDIQAFETEFYKLSGVYTMLYCSPNFSNKYLTDPRLSNYPLWLASYGTQAPPAASVWKTCLMWQYGTDTQVGGVKDPVDVDVANDSVFLPGSSHTALRGAT